MSWLYHNIKRKQKEDLFFEEPKRSPEELFAMAEEAEKLAKTATDNKLTVVRGYRRVGKSSLVRSMLNILAMEKICVPLYADIVVMETEEELADFIKDNFKRTPNILGVKRYRYIKKFDKQLEDKLMKVAANTKSFTSTLGQSPGISVGQTHSKELTQLKLWDLFRGVIEAAEQIKKPVVIVLDEVQNIIEVTKHDQNFLHKFQDLLRFLHGYPDVHLVLTGSHSRLIPIVLGKKYEDPLQGRYIVKWDVHPFNETQAKEYLLKGFQQCNPKIEFEEKWAEDVVNALGGIVGVLAIYGKRYKERFKNVENPPKNLYFDVLKEVANNYENAIKDDLKTFVKYATEESIEESLLFDVIKAVSTYKFENNLDPSFNQVKGYVDKFGSNGNVKQALDILKDYEIVDVIEEEDKIVLTNPCMAFNAGITPKVVTVERKKIGEIKVVRHPAVPAEEENIIYIGNKPVMNYILAVVTQFNNGFDKVVIKARGRAISRAVDTAEVVKNKFMPNVEVKDIRICTETVVSEDGDKANVGSMEIVLGVKE